MHVETNHADWSGTRADCWTESERSSNVYDVEFAGRHPSCSPSDKMMGFMAHLLTKVMRVSDLATGSVMNDSLCQ